jgi:hypothetical protein
MQGFEMHDMCDAGYIDPSLKGCRNNDIWALTLEPSLETNFSLSKKVGIAILGIPIVVMAS